MTEALRCPAGHTGPFRYVEQIEILRELHDGATTTEVRVKPEWYTAEGFDEGVPGSSYLFCMATTRHYQRCALEFPLPPGVEPIFG